MSFFNNRKIEIYRFFMELFELVLIYVVVIGVVFLCLDYVVGCWQECKLDIIYCFYFMMYCYFSLV